jgi:peptidoglycan hydrolase-like amidase
MKQILVSAVFSALAILLIPSQLRPDEPVPAVPEDTVLWIEDAGPETHWKETVSEPETAGLETVRLLDRGTVQLLPMDDYLTCVVLSEMPPEFESEALKAQAVAARTFTEKRRLSAKHENADVCSDSACCQAWQSEAALRRGF